MNPVALLKSLRSLIGYHQSCGIDRYHRTAALQSGLARLEAAAAPAPTATATVAPPGAAAPDRGGSAALSIEALAEEVQRCTICPLHLSKNISTPGKGSTRPALLIVGDWLVHDHPVSPGTILGERQEQMLERMVEAIRVDRSRVYITNLIKCSVDDSVRPDADHIEACLSYLKQQITLLSPALICTMGAAPSQALLGSSQPLIRLRGRFHQFRSGSGKTIPLMPTFHPSYLLRNEEMKRPTWEDLQAVEKMLKRSG